MRKRNLILGTAVGFTFGCFLLIVLNKFGLYLPCPVRKFFSILCPFCGITRASIRLMFFDFSGAVVENMAVFFIWAYLIKLYRDFAVNFLKKGQFIKTRIDKIDKLVVLLLIIWGIMRNILGI